MRWSRIVDHVTGCDSKWMLMTILYLIIHSNLHKTETIGDANWNAQKSIVKGDCNTLLYKKDEVDKIWIWIIELLGHIISKVDLMYIYQNLYPDW